MRSLAYSGASKTPYKLPGRRNNGRPASLRLPEEAALTGAPPCIVPHGKLPSAALKYEPQLHVVLHQPEIPYNTGSVGRTCVATGAKLWLVRPLGFRIDDYYLRRAGLDYWEHLEWEVVDDWQALAARLAGRTMHYFSKAGLRLYTDIHYQPGDVLVFGCESRGLPPEMLAAHADQTVRIPIRPQVRSLNLSNAVAVALYEAWRQWSASGPGV